MTESSVAEIELVGARRVVVATSLVDDSDYAWLSQWSWRLHECGYAHRFAYAGGRSTHIYMHRLILGLSFGDPLRCDHINLNPLDNRRANLRVVTKKQNEQNHRSYRGSSSRFRGVYRSKWGTWIAEAKLDGKKYRLGCFAVEEDAGRAASDWRREHMPYAVEPENKSPAVTSPEAPTGLSLKGV